MSVRLGISLPVRGVVFSARGGKVDPGPLLAMAERAEEAGLDSVWVGDSFTDRPRLEPLTTLASVATRSRRLRLGTAVLLAGLRHPIQLAHVGASLDILSGGRLVLGVGVGRAELPGRRLEWQQSGIDPRQRARRLEEVIEIAKRLWREAQVSYDGQHFRLDNVALGMRPVQEGGVPVLFACHLRSGVEAQFRRAAEIGDGVMSIQETPEVFSQVVEKVKQYAKGAGRRPEDLEYVFYVTVNMGPDARMCEEEARAWLSDYYKGQAPPDKGEAFGSPDAVASLIASYANAGATEMVVRFAAYDGLAQLEAFCREVAPQLRDSS